MGNNYEIMITDCEALPPPPLFQSYNLKLFQNKKDCKLTELQGQSDFIFCLTYSMKFEWFASSDWQGNIQLWKQGKSNKEWQPSNIENQQDCILFLLFNPKENQLISCNDDIIVWSVNYEKNQLSYSYTLENKHVSKITCLGLNDSETTLVSGGSEDKKIILWIKAIDDKWQYQNSVMMENKLVRMCFINENQFIIQQAGKGFSNVFAIEDKKLKECQSLKIKLSENDGDDANFFPTIYNKRKDVLIQKSSQYVYILRRDINGQFKVQAEPIDCETKFNYGSMTEDGHHLVIWNQKMKLFKIYQLNYE